MAKGLNRYSEKNICKGSINVTKYRTPLVIREMQIKTTMRCCSISIRMATIKWILLLDIGNTMKQLELSSVANRSIN
jgi:hypothetical protein